MNPPVRQVTRLYRLWRTSALLLGVGAAEFGFLAWQRNLPWLWVVAIGLLAGAGAAIQRAAVQRRRMYG